MSDTSANLTFPLQGIDLSTGFNAQRPGTTTTGQNVRSYDAGTLRRRGGSRSGLTPFLGQGSTAQVNGFALIQHLNTITTVNQAATFGGVVYANLLATVDYSEVNSPPARDAPTATIMKTWYQGTSPNYALVSNAVVGSPDGGGTGKGTSSYNFSTDGTTITIIGTFVSAGFPGPYFFSGPPQVVTKTILASLFLPPTSTVVTFTWAVVAGSFIAQHTVNLSTL